MSRMRFGLAIFFTLIWVLTNSLETNPAAQDHDSVSANKSALDARWIPWIGCWQLWEEQFAQADEFIQDDRSIVSRTSVCMTPTETGMSLVAKEHEQVGQRLLVERHLIADGAKYTIREEGCLGWEQSEWSADGHRLFTSGELRCGNEPIRTVTGVSFMASTLSWVDIQHVQYGDREQLEVRRYSPMPALETEAVIDVRALPFKPAEIRRARRFSTETLSLADVTEANKKTMSRVVEALLIETEPDLNLNLDSLIALDDAGIDDQVIDLLVAMSYPEHFLVEKRERDGLWSSDRMNFGGIGSIYDPIWYGNLYPYYLTPLGSRSYWGGYNPYLYGVAGTPFIVLTGKVQKDFRGHAVAGRGYTRVSPRNLPTQSDNRGGANWKSGGRSGWGQGGGTATSAGYKSGSGGTTTSGRKAVPRKN